MSSLPIEGKGGEDVSPKTIFPKKKPVISYTVLKTKIELGGFQRCIFEFE